MSVDRIVIDETLNPQRITVTETGDVIAITIGDTVLTGAPGPQGEPGPIGPQGIPGAGFPTGGVAGDVLYKASATDFDTEWTSLITKNNEWLATKSTTNLAEGTNLYYTDGRFDTRLATKTTTNLAEGTNLYYTNARVDAWLQGGGVTALNFGNNTTLSWNATDQTLDMPLDGVTIQLGQETVARVVNKTGSTINNGQVVRASGAQGGRMTVTVASNVSDSLSATVLGVATETIANNAEGFITLTGLVRDIDTSALTEGAPIYLTTNGGMTTTQPITPAHLVLIGYCVRSHASVGSIFVKPQNGYEIGELHDVLITNPLNGQILTYNQASDIWVNQTLSFVTQTELATQVNILNNNIDDGDTATLASANSYTDTIAAGKVNTSDYTTLFNTNLSAKTTDNLSEGSTNLYYTASRFDARLATKTTDNLSEGTTNLYYTNGRVDARIGAAVLNDLANVSGTPAAGQVLTYNGTSWAPANASGGNDYTIPSKPTSASNAWSIGPNTLIVAAIAGTSTPNSAGQIRYQPLHVTRAIKITDIRVSIATASSLNNCNIQVWIDNCDPQGATGWQPTSNMSGGYLGEFANVTTTGEKTITGLNVTVQPGYYLIAYQNSSFTGTLGVYNTPGQLSTGNGYILTGSNSYAGVLWSRSGVPYTSGVPATPNNFVPVGTGAAAKEHLVTIQYEYA